MHTSSEQGIREELGRRPDPLCPCATAAARIDEDAVKIGLGISACLLGAEVRFDNQLRHHLQRQGVEYLLRGSYLQPHPRELGLRNRV
jgi:hypothetical protein